MAHYVNQPKRRHIKGRRWLLYGLAAALTLLAVVGVWKYLVSSDSHAPQVLQTQPVKRDISSTLLFVGDVFWGRSMQRAAEASGQGAAYLTSGLSKQDRSRYDAWIANFECPITTRDVPYEQQRQYLKFNCRPEYLPELATWFTAVTLANNHMDNNGGAQGLAETRANLEQQVIQYTGNYDMNQLDDLCEVITIPAKIAGRQTQVAVPIALCGYMYVVDATPTDAQLAVMQRYAKVMPVIAMPHMGIEYRATAEPQKVAAYHRMIDNGADLVIGAHPHVIQNSENYHGKLIAYSVGNFLFDQQSLGRATTLGLGVAVTMTIPDGTAAQAYQKLAPSCRNYKDTCLQQLTAAISTRPTIRVSYDFTCYDEASGVPRLGDAATCDAAKQSATVGDVAHLNAQW